MDVEANEGKCFPSPFPPPFPSHVWTLKAKRRTPVILSSFPPFFSPEKKKEERSTSLFFPLPFLLIEACFATLPSPPTPPNVKDGYPLLSLPPHDIYQMIGIKRCWLRSLPLPISPLPLKDGRFELTSPLFEGRERRRSATPLFLFLFFFL